MALPKPLAIPSFMQQFRSWLRSKRDEDLLAIGTRIDEIVAYINKVNNPGASPGTTLIQNTNIAISNEPSVTTGGQKVLKATAADGVTIVEGAAIYVDMQRKAYPASAARADRRCRGICTAVKGKQVEYVVNGDCRPLLANMSGTDVRLTLSVEPGKLTNNPQEAGAILQQEVATFESWVTDAAGNTLSGCCNAQCFSAPATAIA